MDCLYLKFYSSPYNHLIFNNGIFRTSFFLFHFNDFLSSLSISSEILFLTALGNQSPRLGNLNSRRFYSQKREEKKQILDDIEEANNDVHRWGYE